MEYFRYWLLGHLFKKLLSLAFRVSVVTYVNVSLLVLQSLQLLDVLLVNLILELLSVKATG